MNIRLFFRTTIIEGDCRWYDKVNKLYG